MRTFLITLAFSALMQAGELHQVARLCDVNKLRQLLSTHPALNELDESGRTPLHIVIDSRQRACLKPLLEAGADKNAVDRKGRTPWSAANQITDPLDRTAFLFALKNVNATPREQTGPKPWSLEYSVLHKQTNVTAMLLKMGVDPNATGTTGTTPLADAALKGDLDGVRLLIAYGAKVNAVSKAGTQPIHDAALSDNPDVIQELVSRGADANALSRDGRQTPLHVAAGMGKLNAVKTLIAVGADQARTDNQGRTPLKIAERLGLAEVAAYLRQAVRK